MSVESALQALRLEPRFMRNVVRWVQLPARAARCAAWPPGLAGRLIAALQTRGVSQLYAHQAEAVAAALVGDHTAIVTPAASGKTLCYNLPVLNRLLADPQARALYLFPTKALAQDQLAELRDLLGHLATDHSGPSPALPIATYDGDTPSAQRARVRDAARIILSNPDMLHMGIMPQHTRWAGFFANLRVVVIDEMHVYRGLFGSHVANVLRRLRRICRFHGSQPQFILASATIANPAELAERLVEAPVTIIGPEQDGAPAGIKHVIFYNPPLFDPALGIRRSSALEAADIAAHFLAHDVQTIVFARARLTTELILSDLRSQIADLRSRNDDLPSILATPQAVRGYRGGYLPDERRAIERGLREASVRGVVATNALELGIDIGRLDATVLAGYPGTIASTRQQMGRAGRRQDASVAVLTATAGPLDQYIIQHPQYLLERSPERALLDPDNDVILASHLACAAAELPLVRGEGLAAGRWEREVELLDDLAAAGQLYGAGGRYYWGGAGSPAANVSLRASSADRVVIQVPGADGKPQVIGELDRAGVPRLLYEGAIYLHEAATYRVERLDWDAGVAHLRTTEVEYYTRPSIAEEVKVLAEREARASAEALSRTAWGDVRVVSRATGYRIIRRTTNETLGFGAIDLPAQVLETQGCWLALAEALVERLRAAGAWFSDPNDYGPNWAGQRAAVRARDGYRCQACGAAEPGVTAQPGLPTGSLAQQLIPSPAQPDLPTGPATQHHVHHRIPFRAFVADASLRNGLPADQAWQIANRLDNLVTLCASCHRQAEASVRIRSGLGGAAALLTAVAPLFLMCDPADLGAVVEPQAPGSGLPTITIHERTAGGVGYAQALFEGMPDLLTAAHDLVAACPCEHGCPSCVGPALEHEYALDAKSLAAALLRELVPCENRD